MGIYDDPPDKQKIQCKYWARQRGMAEDWEDFYQHIQVVKLKGWKQTYAQASFDYYRESHPFSVFTNKDGKQYAREYHKTPLAMRPKRCSSAADDEENIGNDSGNYDGWLIKNQTNVHDAVSVLGKGVLMTTNFEDSWGPVKEVYDEYIHLFEPGTESAIFVLSFLMDYSHLQLGKLFNCTESNISHKVKVIKGKLVAEIKRRNGDDVERQFKKTYSSNHKI